MEKVKVVKLLDKKSGVSQKSGKPCIGGKTKCVKMNETQNQWKAL